jgi:hypothetical protein
MDALINYYINEFGDGFRSHLLIWGELSSISESELIESLSMWAELDNADINQKLCSQIVNSVRHKNLIQWNSNELKIHDKAYIIKQLSHYGIGVYLAGLDPFPSCSDDFLKNTHKLPRIFNIKIKINLLRSGIAWIFANKFTRLSTIILIISGLCFFSHQLLIPSLIFSWVVWLLIFMHSHDYLVHQYIVPKNKVIDTVLSWIVFIWLNRSGSEGAKRSHMAHHIFWKDENLDPFQSDLKSGKILYLLGLSHIPGEKVIEIKSTNQLLFIEKYHTELILLFCISLILFFNLETFFYFYIIPRFLVTAIPDIPHVFQHGFSKTAEEESDFIWLIPLFGIAGNHISHHNSRKAIYGTTRHDWVKWINIHFYIFKLLYNENKKPDNIG